MPPRRRRSNASGNGDGAASGDGEVLALVPIEPIEIQEEMERSYLDYAISTLTARALPDAKDGLKPSQRRILYSMWEQGFRPDRPHVKSARVVGDVIAKYHPHGTEAVYSTLVRLGQDFSLRHRLVDPHGNFGTPDAPPGAMRYCLTGDARVRLADGTTRAISQLAPGALPNSDTAIEEKVLDAFGNPVAADVLFHSGEHPTRRLVTRAGFELTGTHNHPVLCLAAVDGVPRLVWRTLARIAPGDTVCISRAYQEDACLATDDDHDLGVLAGMLVSEGWASDARVGFYNTDDAFFALAATAYMRIIGGTAPIRNGLTSTGFPYWRLDAPSKALKESCLADLVGKYAAHKRIPEVVWRGSLALKRAFLQALFEGDGSVYCAPKSSIQIHYSTYSKDLALDVQRLLLEFGLIGRVSASKGGREWIVSFSNRREARRFADRVNFLTAKREQLELVLAAVSWSPRSGVRSRSADRVPFVAQYIRGDAGRGHKEWLGKHLIDRWERLEELGETLLDRINNPKVVQDVRRVLEPGYFYDSVKSVEDAGVQDVYSVRVASDDHSFLANGFVNHNTECRLAPLAMEMMAGIDENTVDMIPNFSYDEEQPAVLPSRFPNLLVNGSQGIAVGMATNIPTHNLGEIIDATVHLIDNPNSTPDDLMQFVKGPDFPTSALILGRKGILDAFRTGRGSIRLRARAEIEELRRGPAIVVTQIPYQTSTSAIATKIAELVNSKVIDGIRNVNDESAKGNTRLVIDLKRDANANVVLNNLWKHTPMQSTFAVNFVALVDGVPRTLNLSQALSAYIEHQVDVIRRRSEFRLKKARDRAHIVEGFIKALDLIDQIIALIRASEDRAAARAGLMARPFEFSEVQANAILDLTLARLTRLSRREFDEELKELRATIAELAAILADEGKLRAVIKTELGDIKEKYASARKTEITFDPGEMSMEDLIDDQEVVVTMSRAGYVKTVQSSAFRTQGRGGRGVAGAKLREEDLVTDIIHTTTHSYLLLFSNRGKVYRLRVHEVPMKERTARGTAIQNLLPLEPDERIQAIIDTKDFSDDRYLFFATKRGVVKKTLFSEYDKSRREGFIAINLKADDELVRVITTSGSDDIFIVTRNGMTVRFSEGSVRPTGRGAQGVIGMRLKRGDEVVSCDVARDDVAILIVTDAGYGKRTQLDKFARKGRGIQGVRGIRLTAKRGYVVAAFMVGLEDEVFLISSAGVTVRIPVRGISSQGRDATGVRVMNLDAGQTIASAAPILAQEEEMEPAGVS